MSSTLNAPFILPARGAFRVRPRLQQRRAHAAAPTRLLRSVACRAEAAAEVVELLEGSSVFLVGMMGTGKSSVGKKLAAALGYSFFDTCVARATSPLLRARVEGSYPKRSAADSSSPKRLFHRLARPFRCFALCAPFPDTFPSLSLSIVSFTCSFSANTATKSSRR
jgi:hypothetical protein